MSTTYPPAGWYTDPSDSTRQRYWTGSDWGQETRSAGQPAADNSRSTPPPPPMGYGQQPPAAATGNGFSIAGIILGAIAFLILPIVFGPLGLIFGAIAKSKGEEKANTALTVAGIGLVAGMIFGAIIGASTF